MRFDSKTYLFYKMNDEVGHNEQTSKCFLNA